MDAYQKLNSMGGKFTTLVVRRNGLTETYCAKIDGATNKVVSFYDINSGRERRVATKDVAMARSGDLVYRKR